MRVAFAAGGTGGHILPALVVWEQLARTVDGAEARFFGPDDRGERSLVEPALPFVAVPAAPIRGRTPLALARSLLRIAKGVLRARSALAEFRPQVVFSTGGYGSFPTVVAAKLLRLPVVVYLPDVSPGLAVRVERWLADRIGTSTEAALAHLPRRKTVVTGYPVREAFWSTTRAEARRSLGLGEERVLLVAGATQGAHAINVAVFEALEELCRHATLFHVTGTRDIATAESLRASLPPPLQERYRPAAYRADLPLLMLAADLAVMRAGASVLGELPAAALPAILVPGTYAGGHQRENARWLAGAGAAVVLEEGELSQLPQLALDLLARPERLREMSEAARRLARPDAAEQLARLLAEVAA